jgi:selenocysteine-specific elongation factor
MYVVATAGHVDHGKSTLLRALTGMEPDRWAEERRRGLTIDLGFVWTELRGASPEQAKTVAFVDVPGHERFVPNMLAGIGPANAVLFVVAADEGWMPQSEEHLAALDALGVTHGLLAVTKADTPGAEPELAREEALARIGETGLGPVPALTVSGRTGDGLDELRRALAALVSELPEPDPRADVRLWIDRAFTVRGAGTVVTGTLTGGTLRVGDELALASTGARTRVRGLQSLGAEAGEVTAMARVAVNLRRVGKGDLGRGDALLTPHAWYQTREADVALRGLPAAELHRELMLHLGTGAQAVRIRALGEHTARLALAEPLPLRVGDRGLLRDPGEHRIAAGIVVADVDPPPLRRRGAARARAVALADALAAGDSAARLAEAKVADRAYVPAAELPAMGLPEAGLRVGEWCVHPQTWEALRERAPEELTAFARGDPVAAGMPVEVLRAALGLPTAELVAPLLEGSGCALAGGLVSRSDAGSLPPRVHRAVQELEARLAEAPFQAPEADELARLGLGRKELAAAGRAGRLTRLAEGVVLGPDALTEAERVLRGLAAPFTVSQARQTLQTTRRIAVPLMEALDAAGATVPLGDGTRRMRT